LAIVDIFSKRQRALRGESPDVYTYSDLPRPLRTQVVQIWLDTLGNASVYDRPGVGGAYRRIVETLRREYGVFRLPAPDDREQEVYIGELVSFFLHEADVERALDAVELSFRIIDRYTRDWDYMYRSDASEAADAAIEELNARFREHGVGYQYTDGEIIRIDSELLHAEVVKPALRLLNGKQYAGAQQEFLKAHEHYRVGNAKEALNESLKALESVMKAICDKRGWIYGKGCAAKDLIQVCLDKELIPAFWQQHYSSLRSLLESSVPTGRNKLSAHGQGNQPVDVPTHLVSYMLHMTASAIVFLAEAEASLP